MITDTPQENTKYVILRGISANGIPTRFFTMYRPGVDYTGADFCLGNESSAAPTYEVVKYATRVRDCQVFLYGYASCDHDD